MNKFRDFAEGNSTADTFERNLAGGDFTQCLNKLPLELFPSSTGLETITNIGSICCIAVIRFASADFYNVKLEGATSVVGPRGSFIALPWRVEGMDVTCPRARE
ncbi:hypothetical protein Tcan_06463 [Toxocara canis]|uniref:Uncharacterized protein n=1 Tax=Toxocara canis TaxID=6265 RepID=A0A0B2V672_TOXCA|nr:hypothetical protein Tcan_06463 [Toxocara canis]